METTASFGTWLSQRRRSLNLTRNELAQRVGCSVSTLRKIESDERRPSLQIAELLAQHLQVPIDQRLLFLKVARGELSVLRLESQAVGDQATSPPSASNLPMATTRFIGREHELTELSHLLRDPQCRLLTLTGPGGIGKTRLAIEVATAARDVYGEERYFVSLAAIDATSFITPAIAAAIGFSLYGADDPEAQLINHLRGKRLLLVIDNVEHLLQDIHLLGDILRQAPHVKLLATSRERLNLSGEWVFEIQGLPAPPIEQTAHLQDYSAVQLFIDSARHTQFDFQLTPENEPAVADICRLVEGMPLGIELAAAWVRVLSCQAIAQEIERNLDFLITTARDVPERHRSLRAAFDHSWALLSAEEQRALRELSVFRGGFRRVAAERVAHTSLPLLLSLTAKSLVHRSDADRYDLHELIRQYTEAHLRADHAEYDAAHDRHSLFYLALLHEREPLIQSAQQPAVVTELMQEIDNVRLAVSRVMINRKYAEMTATWDCLWTFYDIRGWFQEAIDVAERVIDSLQSAGGAAAHPIDLGHAERFVGWFYFRRGRYRLARDVLEQSLTHLRSVDDPVQLPAALISCAVLTYRMGDHLAALRLSEEALAITEAHHNYWLLAWVHVLLGTIHSILGHDDAAYDYLSTGVSRMRLVGDVHLLSFALTFYAPIALRHGHYDEAQALLRESLELSNRISDRWTKASACAQLGALACAQGDLEQAQLWLRQGMVLFDEIGSRGHMVQPLTQLAEVALATGDEAEAHRLFQQAIRIAAEVQAIPALIEALVALSAMLARDPDQMPCAFEWLLVIEGQSAASHAALDRAARLRTELQRQFAPSQIEAITAAARAKSLNVIAAEAIADRVEGAPADIAPASALSHQ